MISLDNESIRVIAHIAETQEEIFEYAISNGYFMDDFIKKYMSSDFCNREMDSSDSYFHFKTPEVCFSCLKNELHDFKKGENDFYDVGWVGKMYRYLAYSLEFSSLAVYNLIRPHELDAFAISCELLNEKDAVEEIIKKIDTSKMRPQSA